MGNGTFVGLDVHARSVVAGLIDEASGEVAVRRAPHRTDELVGWLGRSGRPGAGRLRGRPDRLWPGARVRGCGDRLPGGRPEPDPALLGRARSKARCRRRRAAWRARCGRASSRPCGCPIRQTRPPATWCAPARTPAPISCGPAIASPSSCCATGCSMSPGAPGPASHDAWLRAQRLEHHGARAAFEDYYGATLAAGLRRDGLDRQIEELAADPRFAPVVGRLACLRGVGTLTAFALAVEIGDWHRLSGASIGAYLGLVPTEAQSGARHRRGPITKAGNSPRPPAAGRGGLAPPAPAARQRRDRAPAGRPAPRGGRPRRAGGPAPSPALEAP